MYRTSRVCALTGEGGERGGGGGTGSSGCSVQSAVWAREGGAGGESRWAGSGAGDVMRWMLGEWAGQGVGRAANETERRGTTLTSACFPFVRCAQRRMPSPAGATPASSSRPRPRRTALFLTGERAAGRHILASPADYDGTELCIAFSRILPPATPNLSSTHHHRHHTFPFEAPCTLVTGPPASRQKRGLLASPPQGLPLSLLSCRPLPLWRLSPAPLSLDSNFPLLPQIREHQLHLLSM